MTDRVAKNDGNGSSDDDSTLITDAALACAGRGWPVFPVDPNTKKPYLSAKFSNGQRWGQTIDPDVIRRYWRRFPHAAIGIATGTDSGVWVIEADTMKGHGVDGLASLRALEADHGILPATLMAESPSESKHHYFTHPGSGAKVWCSSSKIALGIDVKGDGGFVIVPPSVRRDGTYRWLNEAEPVDAPEWLIARVTVSSGSGTSDRGGGPADEQQASIERVIAAFAVIANPDLGWDDWNTHGMAIYAATGGSDEGLAVFDAWSKKSRKCSEEATAVKWEEFHGCPPTEIGAGSIFHWANEACPGWEALVGLGIEHATEVVRLAALSLIQYDQERNEAAKRLGIKRGVLDDIIEKLRQPVRPSTSETLMEMNDKFCVVEYADKARILTFKEVPRPHGGGTRVLAVFYRAGDFKLLYDNRKVRIGTSTGVKLVGRATWWINQKDRRQYKGVIFRPGEPEEIDDCLNLWRGWGVQPRPGNWSLMKQHINEVLADGDETCARYIINWTAWALQNPGRMAEVALVFKGKKGTGKGVFVRALLRMFGQHGFHISSMKHLTGSFNAHLMDCSLLYADEAYWPGDKSAEGTLKLTITEEALPIEKKGFDVMSTENRLHIIMSGNADWLAPASIDERRFAAFGISDKYIQNRVYFDALFKETFEDGGLEAMMFDLLARDLGAWHPRYDVPQTETLEDQKKLSLPAEEQWWVYLLEEGTLPGSKEAHPRRARSELLYDEAKRLIPGLKFHSPHLLGRILKKHGCTKVQVDERRGWEFPVLAKARAEWDQRIGGGPTEWGDQGDWEERKDYM